MHLTEMEDYEIVNMEDVSSVSDQIIDPKAEDQKLQKLALFGDWVRKFHTLFAAKFLNVGYLRLETALNKENLEADPWNEKEHKKLLSILQKYKFTKKDWDLSTRLRKHKNLTVYKRHYVHIKDTVEACFEEDKKELELLEIPTEEKDLIEKIMVFTRDYVMCPENFIDQPSGSFNETGYHRVAYIVSCIRELHFFRA